MLAANYAFLGEKDAAVDCLNHAYERHSFGLIFLAVAPEYDSLRADPRFLDLVRRVGVAAPNR